MVLIKNSNKTKPRDKGEPIQSNGLISNQKEKCSDKLTMQNQVFHSGVLLFWLLILISKNGCIKIRMVCNGKRCDGVKILIKLRMTEKIHILITI